MFKSAAMLQEVVRASLYPIALTISDISNDIYQAHLNDPIWYRTALNYDLYCVIGMFIWDASMWEVTLRSNFLHRGKFGRRIAQITLERKNLKLEAAVRSCKRVVIAFALIKLNATLRRCHAKAIALSSIQQ